MEGFVVTGSAIITVLAVIFIILLLLLGIGAVTKIIVEEIDLMIWNWQREWKRKQEGE